VTRVLIVEDEACIRGTLSELFDVPANETVAAATLAEARQALAEGGFDLVVTDLRLGDRRDGGLQVLGACGLLSPDAPVIVLTAYPDAGNRLATERLGATYFLEKPVDLHTIAALAGRSGVATSFSAGTEMGTETGTESEPARLAT